MRHLLATILVTTALVPGCSGGTTPERTGWEVETEDRTETEPEPEADDPSVPAQAPADPCAAHAAEFRRVMAEATGRCSANTDCGCFSPVVGEAGCGGITDRATADRLRAIERAFRAEPCPWPHQCGPWRCEPVCRDGRCVNSQRGGHPHP